MSAWSKRPLVLLAEDEPDIRRLVATLLERWGYEVAAAASGDEALALAAARPPALAILDVSIPGPNGIEVTRRLRSDDDVPVILLTAHAGDRSAAEAVLAGASGLLTKPFRAQALRKAIWSVLPPSPEAAA